MTSTRRRPFGPRRIGEYAQGYAQGFRDGTTAQPDRELYALVDVAWSAVRTEDTIMGEDGALYHVVRSGAVPVSGAAAQPDGTPAAGWIVTLVCGTYRGVHELDHDARVRALVPVGLADALTVSRAGLPGARLIATRTGRDGGTDADPPWRVEITGLPRPAG